MFIPSVKSKKILYVWVDDDEHRLRSKAMVFEREEITDVSELPLLKLTTGEKVACTVKPITVFNDPFALSKNRLIFCEMLNNQGQEPSMRSKIVKSTHKAGAEKPMFDLEQDFTFLGQQDWHEKLSSYLTDYKKSPAGLEAKRFAQIFYGACLYAGVDIKSCEPSGIETKWSFRLGVKNGHEAYDNLWVARYVLHRIGEQEGISIALGDPPKRRRSELKLNGLLIKFSTSKKLINDPGCPVLQSLGSFLKAI